LFLIIIIIIIITIIIAIIIVIVIIYMATTTPDKFIPPKKIMRRAPISSTRAFRRLHTKGLRSIRTLGALGCDVPANGLGN
jgi:hypothetical protein